MNTIEFDNLPEHVHALKRLEDQSAWIDLEKECFLLVENYINNHVVVHDIILQLSQAEAVESAKFCIYKFLESSSEGLLKFDELIARLASLNLEDKAYSYVLSAIKAYPNDVKLIEKAAELSLYLGYMDEAYHWIASLDFYTPVAKKAIRKSRLELLMGKKQAARDFQIITGKIFLRSTGAHFKAEDPPGEKEILALNPQREENIKQLASWDELYPGTLNVRTAFSPTEIFHNIPPIAYEAGCTVTYTANYSNVPKSRVGYWYYPGFVFAKGRFKPVLFKYPDTPYSEFTLEIFSPFNLRADLELSDNDPILCYFASTAEDGDAWRECKLNIYSVFSSNQQVFGRHGELYQGHEDWRLPGQRPTMLRANTYALNKWIEPHHHILDIGCNIGCFGIETSKLGASYTGFDNNADVIKIANYLARHNAAENCTFLTSTFDEFQSNNKQQYDVIFSFAVHVWIGIPMQDYIEKLKGMLAPQGVIIIESNNLDKNDMEFMQNMRLFLTADFILLHQGEITDDGVIRRAFCVFQSLK